MTNKNPKGFVSCLCRDSESSRVLEAIFKKLELGMTGSEKLSATFCGV